uniref:Ankyrin repeat protein n=1 Tax=Neogobius melanostomus TaxID=47308 RepID=A0A8C6SFM7_9GOBI
MSQLTMTTRGWPELTCRHLSVPFQNGYTPLHIAAKKNQMEIATVLLQYGAETNIQTKQGVTPLHLASQEGHIVNFLLQNGASVNAKTKNGYTPLHQAAQQGNTHVINVLLQFGSIIKDNYIYLSIFKKKKKKIKLTEPVSNITHTKVQESKNKRLL